ncbi:hypothetical protein HMPREF3036_02654 [Sutterella sp. KLE1602]|nr:hypothetical protein HMPREF3036_02654 [Sutterella sp. KLE1602]
MPTGLYRGKALLSFRDAGDGRPDFEKPGPCVLRLILWYAREPFPSSLNTHDFAS